ncbi:hypothetical protein BP6252_12639 [Coleophoma cylindrospora]|uniref:Uncharacterized protein n=1 Tax=Coleophoma cylindrospora TaxID=1849047 RepID=A0A3D8QCH2_9HELO|nr:hypothetical protein BP6252_12639 [Coleophoma cylindrospora]
MNFQGLQIGIELEVLLTPQNPPPGGFKDLEHFGRSIAQRWNRESAVGMAKMHVDIDGAYEGENENLEWSVTDDETLIGLEDTETGRWALEFTSPILQYVPSKSWRGDIQAFWNFFDQYMFIETDPKCGTHIHMSPLEEDLSQYLVV